MENKIKDTSSLKQKYQDKLSITKNNLIKKNKSKTIDKIDKILENLSKVKQQKVFDKIQKLKKKNDIINYLEAKIYLNL